jgi:hypothetical protein
VSPFGGFELDRVFDFAGLHIVAKAVCIFVCVFVGPLAGPVFGGFELDGQSIG